MRPHCICMWNASSCMSSGGTQSQPCSVSTSLRFGNRSNAPLIRICHSGRWAYHDVSIIHWIVELGYFP